MTLELWQEYHAGEAADFATRPAELRFGVSYLLRERSLRGPTTGIIWAFPSTVEFFYEDPD